MRTPPKRRGTCQVCGCIDARACEGGCRWTDPSHTLCSACAEPRCLNCAAYAIDRIGAERAKTVRAILKEGTFVPSEAEDTHGRVPPAMKSRWLCPLCIGKAVA